MKGIAIVPIIASIMILGVIVLQEADAAKTIFPRNTTILDDVFIPAQDTWIVKPGATLTIGSDDTPKANTVEVEGDIVVERDATLFQDNSLLEILGGSIINEGLWNGTLTSKVRNEGEINNLSGGILNASGSMDVLRSGKVNNAGYIIIVNGTMDILPGGFVNNNDGGEIHNLDAVIVQRIVVPTFTLTGKLNNNENAVYFNNGTFILTGEFNNKGDFFDFGDTFDVSGARGVGIIADRDTDRIFVFNQDKELLELFEMFIGLDSIEETKKTEPYSFFFTDTFLPFGGIFNFLFPFDLPDDEDFSISIEGDSIVQDPKRGTEDERKKFKSKTMIK